MRTYLFSLVFLVLLSCSTTAPKSTTSTAVTTGFSSVDKVKTDEGIAGTWLMTLSTPRGKRETKLTIQLTNATNALGKDKQGEFPIRIDGENIRFSRTLSARGNNIAVDFVGKIKSLDNLTGTMKMKTGPGAGREMDWFAVRE